MYQPPNQETGEVTTEGAGSERKLLILFCKAAKCIFFKKAANRAKILNCIYRDHKHVIFLLAGPSGRRGPVISGAVSREARRALEEVTRNRCKTHHICGW